MTYRGMTGMISIDNDRMGRAILEELQLSTPCYINLRTCEAYIPTGGGTYCHRLSVLDLASVLARTPARRRRFGVTVSSD